MIPPVARLIKNKGESTTHEQAKDQDKPVQMAVHDDQVAMGRVRMDVASRNKAQRTVEMKLP